MRRTRHPIFKEEDFTDADDMLLEQGVGGALPDFVDRIAGLQKKEDEDDEY